MAEKKLFPTISPMGKLSSKHIFWLLLFFVVPLIFFVSNFIGEYRSYYYSVLALFVGAYAIVGHFFFKRTRLGDLEKKLIALIVINTVIISLVNFTGNAASHYFFILYFLMFAVAIFASAEVFVLECVIILTSVVVLEVHKVGSFGQLFGSLSPSELANLISIPVTLPLMMIIAAFVRNLQEKQELFLLSKEMLALEDVEDQILLEEIDQGLIVLDTGLTIVKVSKWIEKNLGMVSELLVYRNLNELEFYDPLTNLKLARKDHFYKNLTEQNPQKLNFRVLYQDKEGKFKKYVVKQNPLHVDKKLIGFLLTVRLAPKTVSEAIMSFDEILRFRLSSSIALIRNITEVSDEIKGDSSYPTLKKHIDLIIQILNDNALKSDIASGNYTLQRSTVDLKKLLSDLTRSIDPSQKDFVLKLSDLCKIRPIYLNTDARLCEKLVNYILSGANYFARGGKVDMELSSDEKMEEVILKVTVGLKEEFLKVLKVVEPFFAGQVVVLSKYIGTGLEFSNADLIAKFLGFDFDAGIDDSRLVVKVEFVL